MLQSEFFHGKKEMLKRVFSPAQEDGEMAVDEEEEATGGGEASETVKGREVGEEEVTPTSTGSFPSFPPSPGLLSNLDDLITS